MKRILEALTAYPYRFRSRTELRDAVGHVLERRGLYARKGCEAGCPQCDFLVDGWAVLVAMDGSLAAVTKAARNVAGLRESKGLVLLTCRVLHTRLPRVLWGKPTFVVNVGAPLGARPTFDATATAEGDRKERSR